MAVIGGVALAAYGNPRLTLHLDVATDAAAQDTLIAFMESQDFLTLHRSPGYSNHRHAQRGRVDFMYVRGDTADRLFRSTTELAGPAGNPIPVPKPEHLIAMKVQAMRDVPARGLQDLVDIARDSNEPLDLARDVPTTPEDVAALRQLRRDVPGWFSLTPAEFAALVPAGALDRMDRGLPRALRTDNGLEFCGRAMLTWAHDRGVALRLIEPCHPFVSSRIELILGLLGRGNSENRKAGSMNSRLFTARPARRVLTVNSALASGRYR